MPVTFAASAPAPPRPYQPWSIGSRYDPCSWAAVAMSGVAISANKLYAVMLVPISHVPGGVIGLTSIDYRLTANAASGKKVRLALYTMGATGEPDQLIAQSVELAADAGATATFADDTFVAAVRDLVPIFGCIWGDGTPSVICAGGNGSGQNVLGTTAAGQGGANVNCWSVSATYTAGSSSYPQTFPTAGRDTIGPNIAVRRGS